MRKLWTQPYTGIHFDVVFQAAGVKNETDILRFFIGSLKLTNQQKAACQNHAYFGLFSFQI